MLADLPPSTAYDEANKLVTFWHNEIARQEAAFIGLLLPASLTAASLSAAQISAAIPSPIKVGAATFFIAYLGLLLWAINVAEQANRAANSVVRLTGPHYRSEGKLGSHLSSPEVKILEEADARLNAKYGRASGKPFIALIISGVATMVSYLLTHGGTYGL